MFACLHAHKSLCKWGCSLVSWSSNCSAHTWLHSSTFRHSDESHAPFLHFCSYSVLLGHTDSYLSVSHMQIDFLWVPVSIRGAHSWKTCLKRFTSKVFCSPFLSWQWTVRSWWTLLQPLYVNTAVTRPSLGISKIVSAHSCQTAATQRLTVGHGPRSDEKTSEEGGRS